MEQYTIPDMTEYLSKSIGELVLKQAQYIRAERPEVMEQLIRDFTPERLMYKLKSQYILSSTLARCAEPSQMVHAVLFAFLGNAETLPESLAYLIPLFPQIDIHIVTDTLDIYRAITQSCARIQGRFQLHLWSDSEDGEPLRDTVRRYQYICVVHDMQGPQKGVQGRILETEFSLIWDNLLKSPAYTQNVLSTLAENPDLGVLLPPRSMYRGTRKEESRDAFRLVHPRLPGMSKFRWLADNRNTCCWCREEIFEQFLLGKGAENYPDIAKKLGYITGITMTDIYGGIQANNLDAILHNLIAGLWKPGLGMTLSDYMREDDSLRMMDLWAFFAGHSSLMIYGTGAGAESVRPYFKLAGKQIEGYIVSEGYRTEDLYEGIPVYTLPEVDRRDDLGIVVAMTAENTRQVLPALERGGYDIFLCANIDRAE